MEISARNILAGKTTAITKGPISSLIMIQDLEFGEVQLSVHRGQGVGIRTLEKIRFEGTPLARH